MEGKIYLLYIYMLYISYQAHLIFLHLRFQKMQERNTKNQKKHTMPHVCGRKSFSRKRNDITIRTGKTPCRAEFFIETRTKPDGSFVCEEAKTRAEALTTLLNQNSHGTSNVAATLDDEFAQVFGPERPGRVRCVGRGPTPSKLVRRCTATRQEVDNSEMVVGLQTQVKELSNQVKGMSTFIQQIIGTSTGEQARAWAASFAVAFANIPNPPFANIPTPSNPNQVNSMFKFKEKDCMIHNNLYYFISGNAMMQVSMDIQMLETMLVIIINISLATFFYNVCLIYFCFVNLYYG
ncbi:uncharacterized protein LOC125585404 isoform X2 [Brassica napus]|uniref:uncharacterized protein LOC125585404 isoform X2 n=1 Tax=Brassica napus TaxID=3708 RepID=UPI0020798907|nr:uncharacterized protein LOC125585404 isoform X2 [Brassica napus]